MGLRGDACIVGIAERPSERKFGGTPTLTIEQWAGLAADALADAGIDAAEVDGLVCGGDMAESSLFVPATIAEYCGWSVNFAERIDLGGASAVGMVWRAAAAIELGICEVVVCATVGQPRPKPPVPPPANPRVLLRSARARSGVRPRRSSTCRTATWRRTAATRCTRSGTTTSTGGTSAARAKIASDQRVSACANPAAAFYGQPITVDDVLGVAPDRGAAPSARDRHAVLRRRRVRRHDCRARARLHVARSVHVAGFGERLTHKTPTYAAEMPRTPVRDAATRAFGMSGLAPADIDMVQLYDCYTITALLTIEDSGFCGEGEGLAFVARPRPLVPWRLPVQHARRSAGHGSDRVERRHVARARRRCARSRAAPASVSWRATRPRTSAGPAA